MARVHTARVHTRRLFFWDVSIRNSLRSKNVLLVLVLCLLSVMPWLPPLTSHPLCTTRCWRGCCVSMRLVLTDSVYCLLCTCCQLPTGTKIIHVPGTVRGMRRRLLWYPRSDQDAVPAIPLRSPYWPRWYISFFSDSLRAAFSRAMLYRPLRGLSFCPYIMFWVTHVEISHTNRSYSQLTFFNTFYKILLTSIHVVWGRQQ